jgi:predicted Zn-dependent protease
MKHSNTISEKARKSEMIEVCFDPTVAEVALIPELCKGKGNPSEYIHWDHMPLGIYLDGHGKNADAALKAIEVWKGWLGFSPFEMVSSAEAADIVILEGPDHPMYRGMTIYARTKAAGLFSMIIIYESALGDVGTMTHELGHVIGLEHDPDNIRSIMYPNNGRFMPWLEAQDKLLLQQLYRKTKRPKTPISTPKNFNISDEFQESLLLNTATP